MKETCPICSAPSSGVVLCKGQVTFVACSHCFHVWDRACTVSDHYNTRSGPVEEKFTVARRRFEIVDGELRNKQQIAARFARRLDRTIPYLQAQPVRALDIGVGSGGTIYYFERQGYQPYGVDTNVDALEFVKTQVPQAHLQQGYFEEVELPTTFDLITALHTLEHVGDPLAFLRKCHRVANPAAVMLIEVPHIYSRAARSDPMHWHLIGARVHLHHFSLLSLQLALASSGWVLREVIRGLEPTHQVLLVIATRVAHAGRLKGLVEAGQHAARKQAEAASRRQDDP